MDNTFEERDAIDQADGAGGGGGPETAGSAEGDVGSGSGAGAGEGAGGASGHRGWPGWGSLSDIQDAVGDLVDTAMRNVAPAAGRFPRYDLVEVPHEGYRLLFDLPGMTKGDVDVRVSDGEIVVEGTRARPDVPEGSDVHRSERTYGRFRRVVRVPTDADLSAVAARMEDGVLHVSLPRRGPADGIKVEVD